jgi:hypothetical protein
MIAFSFLLSCFFASSKTATVFAYLVVFGTGLIGSLLLSQVGGGEAAWKGRLGSCLEGGGKGGSSGPGC